MKFIILGPITQGLIGSLEPTLDNRHLIIFNVEDPCERTSSRNLRKIKPYSQLLVFDVCIGFLKRDVRKMIIKMRINASGLDWNQ
jgi:hypothetical protein